MPTEPMLHAIVPAGGAGTRLWPLSRRAEPKFLLDLTGAGRSLLQQTVDRLRPLTGPGGVTVVTGRAHAPAVAAQLPELDPAQVLAEPSPRDSMAAIGLAAAVIRRRHGDVVVGSFAADHVIAHREVFVAAVREAAAAARAGYLATIGIEADHPSTAFGYVHAGEPLGVDAAPSARRVRGFTEKPDAETAAAYLATGEYRWNAGMFVVRAQVLLELLRRHRPGLHAGLSAIAGAWDTPERDVVLGERWEGLEKIAIDHALAEPVAAEGGVAVVPADMGWDDVGGFDSLAPLLPRRGSAAVLGDAPVVVRDSDGAVVVARGGRAVALAGVPGVVVVDTGDALLVTTRERAQEVKHVVEALPANGLDRLL